MATQNQQPTATVNRVIKIEPEEETPPTGESGENIPCVSAALVTAEENRVYYFPTQAVLTTNRPTFPMNTRPRLGNLNAMQKWAQKRKTLEAIAQGALQNASEPILFEETLSHASTKIKVFDNQTKVEVHIPRQEYKEKLKNNTVLVAQNKPNTTTDPKHFPKIGNCYSLQNDKIASSGTTRTVGLATVTHCAVTTNSKTPSMVNIYDTHTRTSNVKTQDQPTKVQQVLSQVQQKLSILAGSIGTKSHTITSSLPSQNTSSTESSNISSDKTLSQLITQKTPLNTQIASTSSSSPNTRVVPCTSVRPDVGLGTRTPDVSKTAVCLPNNALKTIAKESASAAVYVPKEIKVGSQELQLEECVNVRAICDKELTKWTAEDVAKFVRATDCSEYADAFIDQEIDGKALTLLNQELLIQWMKLKLGPAMKLYSHILNLKHALHNVR